MKYWLSETGSLGKPDAAGDYRVKNVATKKFLEVVCNLAGEVGPVIEHCEQNSFQSQAVLERVADSINRVHELGDSLEGEELALDGHENGVGGDQRVEREQVQGRRTVDQYVREQFANVRNSVSQAKFPGSDLDKFEVGPHEIFVSWNQAKPVEPGGDQGMTSGCPAEENVVNAWFFSVLCNSQPGSGIPLRVRVDYQDFEVAGGKGGTEVDGGGCLANSAFLICDGDNPAQAVLVIVPCVRTFHQCLNAGGFT